jgi:hypothetical protein
VPRSRLETLVVCKAAEGSKDDAGPRARTGRTRGATAIRGRARGPKALQEETSLSPRCEKALGSKGRGTRVSTRLRGLEARQRSGQGCEGLEARRRSGHGLEALRERQGAATYVSRCDGDRVKSLSVDCHLWGRLLRRLTTPFPSCLVVRRLTPSRSLRGRDQGKCSRRNGAPRKARPLRYRGVKGLPVDCNRWGRLLWGVTAVLPSLLFVAAPPRSLTWPRSSISEARGERLCSDGL